MSIIFQSTINACTLFNKVKNKILLPVSLTFLILFAGVSIWLFYSRRGDDRG